MMMMYRGEQVFGAALNDESTTTTNAWSAKKVSDEIGILSNKIGDVTEKHLYRHNIAISFPETRWTVLNFSAYTADSEPYTQSGLNGTQVKAFLGKFLKESNDARDVYFASIPATGEFWGPGDGSLLERNIITGFYYEAPGISFYTTMPYNGFYEWIKKLQAGNCDDWVNVQYIPFSSIKNANIMDNMIQIF